MSKKKPYVPTFTDALSSLNDAAVEGYKIEHAITLLNLFARTQGEDCTPADSKLEMEMQGAWLTVEYMAERLAEHHKAITERLQEAESLVENLRNVPRPAHLQSVDTNV